MPEHQGPRRRAAVKIVVHGLGGKTGEDVTSRLHLRNRSQAVAYALREGMI